MKTINFSPIAGTADVARYACEVGSASYAYDATLAKYAYDIWLLMLNFSLTARHSLHLTTTWYVYDSRPKPCNYVDNHTQTLPYPHYDTPTCTTSITDVAVSYNYISTATKYNYDETGRHYYGFRYYMPEIGRWTSRDPIQESGGELLYGFCANSPICLCDELGLDWLDDASNFSAGVADTLTMGVTSWVRQKAGWDTMVDYGGSAYFKGEVTEIVVETTVTLGGAVLRRQAVRISGRAARYVVEGNARRSFRLAHQLTAKGGIVHHINPIRQGRFPLPFRSTARGFWNMEWLEGSSSAALNTLHAARHRYLKLLDTADYLRAWTQPIRNAGNELHRRIMAAGAGAEAVQSPSDEIEMKCPISAKSGWMNCNLFHFSCL